MVNYALSSAVTYRQKNGKKKRFSFLFFHASIFVWIGVKWKTKGALCRLYATCNMNCVVEVAWWKQFPTTPGLIPRSLPRFVNSDLSVIREFNQQQGSWDVANNSEKTWKCNFAFLQSFRDYCKSFGRAKCVVTILELNWCERFVNICHQILSSSTRAYKQATSLSHGRKPVMITWHTTTVISPWFSN